MRDLDQEFSNWQIKRRQLVDLYAKRMEIEYDIKEMTTERQKKNGTRQFVLPNGDKIASYTSGYVRRCNSSSIVYQINKKYKQNTRYTVLSKDKLKTIKTVNYARELINDPLARLLYIIDFCKRNYKLKNLTI